MTRCNALQVSLQLLSMCVLWGNVLWKKCLCIWHWRIFWLARAAKVRIRRSNSTRTCVPANRFWLRIFSRIRRFYARSRRCWYPQRHKVWPRERLSCCVTDTRAKALGVRARRMAEKQFSWSAFLEKNREVYSEFMGTPDKALRIWHTRLMQYGSQVVLPSTGLFVSIVGTLTSLAHLLSPLVVVIPPGWCEKGDGLEKLWMSITTQEMRCLARL